MTGEEFISVATRLLASSREGDLRTAVSRAYYGAFHLARDFVLNCGVVIPSGPEAHKSVRWCLANSGDAELGQCAAWLESLRSARNKADYDLSDNRFAMKPHVIVHVQRAVNFANAVRHPDPNTVGPAMRAYAATISLPVRTVS